MNKAVLKIIGNPLHPRPYSTPVYVKDFDFDFDQGRGKGVWAIRKEDARVFDTPMEALEYVRTVSPAFPVRPDGKPNRPLLAYHIEIEAA